jgi:beta-alanine degradation protein BauB
MTNDPVSTNPGLYSVLFENERVRVLQYADTPGTISTPHRHPDSVMVTLSGFSRRLSMGGRSFDTQLPAGAAVWLPAQEHFGENTGDTETRVIFVELKEPADNPVASEGPPPLGPQ